MGLDPQDLHASGAACLYAGARRVEDALYPTRPRLCFMVKRAPVPKWRLLEQIVACLERGLDPESAVLHDVKLPDLTTGHERQFDVMIRSQQGGRTIHTVVEVQRRNRRVGIGTLQAWCAKADAVGAHQLVCVSAAGYTRPAIDDVRTKMGPRVRLLRLRDLEQDSWPAACIPATVSCRKTSASIPAGRLCEIEVPGVSLARFRMTAGTPFFFRDGGREAISLLSLCDEGIQQAEDRHTDDGVYDERIGIRSDSPIWIEHEGARRLVRKIVLPMQFSVEHCELPIRVVSYECVVGGAEIAWVAAAEGQIGGSDLRLRVTYTPNEDGTFSVGSVEIDSPSTRPVFTMRTSATSTVTYKLSPPQAD